MSAAKDEYEIAQRIVDWLTGTRARGTAGVEGFRPHCFTCGGRFALSHEGRVVLVSQIEEIIQEGLHS